MKTVFDLIGKFCVCTHSEEGKPGEISFVYIVLDKDLTPNQCATGRSILRQAVLRFARQHIVTKGLRRVWLEDWDIKERKVQDDELEEAA